MLGQRFLRLASLSRVMLSLVKPNVVLIMHRIHTDAPKRQLSERLSEEVVQSCVCEAILMLMLPQQQQPCIQAGVYSLLRPVSADESHDYTLGLLIGLNYH